MTMPAQGEDAARLKRQRTDQAISLALESRWEEAIGVNRQILDVSPNDVDSWNRLGKAFLELGRLRESREAYQTALELDPVNTIAKRNLERLANVREEEFGRAVALALWDYMRKSRAHGYVVSLSGGADSGACP